MLRKIVGKIIRAVKVVVYGSEGVGKSTLAAQAPTPVFIDLDDGTTQLDVSRVETPKTWEALIAVILEIAATPGFCKTVILDTADKAEMLCSHYICRQHRVDGIESIGYGKGYTYLQEEFGKLLSALDQVIAAGINVVIIAHAKLRKFEQPDEAGAYDRWELKLTKQVAPLVKEWADALLFLNYKTYVVTTDNNVKKAQGGKRMIFTSHHPTYDAKNRIGLPAELDMSYSSIATLFNDTSQLSTTMAESPHDKLNKLLADAGVSEKELEQAVEAEIPALAGKQVSEYDDSFIEKKLIPYWSNVVDAIKQARNQYMSQASAEASL